MSSENSPTNNRRHQQQHHGGRSVGSGIENSSALYNENIIQNHEPLQLSINNQQQKRSNPMKTLQVCQYYFWGGCFCLPILWLINFLWFFTEAFDFSTNNRNRQSSNIDGDPDSDQNDLNSRLSSEERNKIRIYVIMSGFGSSIWMICLSIWIYLYQTKRSEWGEFGDWISVIIPIGKP